MTDEKTHIYHFTEAEAVEFQKILNETTGVQFSLADAKQLGEMLLRVLVLARDVTVQEEMKKDVGLSA